MKKSISFLLISSILAPNFVVAEEIGGQKNLENDSNKIEIVEKPLVVEAENELLTNVVKPLEIFEPKLPVLNEVKTGILKEESISKDIFKENNVEKESIIKSFDEPKLGNDLKENKSDFEKPNFSAWTYVTFMVYSPELNAYFPQGDTLMIRGQVGETQDLPTPEDPNLIYEKGPTTVTHGKTEQNIQVFYKYKDVKPMGGQISIKYLTTDGKILENETFINGRVDSEYYVDVYDFSSRGYEFSHSTGAPLQGVFDANKKSIVVYYKPIKDAPIESAPITVQYKDESGLNIADSKTMKGNIGDNYNVEIPTIEGYTYKSSSQSLSGTYTDKSSTIVLTYSKNKPVEQAKPVTVNYVDESGKTIKDSETLTGKLGDNFNVKTPAINGYTYKSSDKALTGKFTTSAQSVTLTYAKDSKPVEEAKPVTVGFVDEKGNSIRPNETLTGKLGESFNIKTPKIEGYTYKDSSAPLSGKFTTTAQNVTLTYVKDSKPVEESKPVTVNYVDEKGKSIKTSAELTGKLGENFTVSTPKITGYTYKSASAPLTGKFTTSAQSVVLTYVKDTKPVEESKGKNDTNLEKKKNTEKEEIKKTTNDTAINNKNELPKTNELNTHYGLLGTLFLGLYVLIKRKTR